MSYIAAPNKEKLTLLLTLCLRAHMFYLRKLQYLTPALRCQILAPHHSFGLRAATFTCKNWSSDRQIKQWTMKKWKKRKKMMKKYHQQNLVEHEADSAVRECRTQSLSKLVGVHDQDRRMVWLWAAWATTGKSNFGLRAAYAKLTRSLRGCAGTTMQKPVRLCQVRIHHTSDTPKNLIKKNIQSELTPPLRQQCWQKMLTQAYAHQCFAYATGPYKDPNTKHKHRGLERGSYEMFLSLLA